MAWSCDAGVTLDQTQNVVGKKGARWSIAVLDVFNGDTIRIDLLPGASSPMIVHRRVALTKSYHL